jgi:hypothetical protein
MIAILAATGSVVGFTAGHVSIPISIGIAVIGIVIGTGVARGDSFRPRQSQPRKIDDAIPKRVASS